MDHVTEHERLMSYHNETLRVLFKHFSPPVKIECHSYFVVDGFMLAEVDDALWEVTDLEGEIQFASDFMNCALYLTERIERDRFEKTLVCWNKEMTHKLVKEFGLTLEQARLVVGVMTDERQKADAAGYERGHSEGYVSAEQHYSSL